MSLWTSSVITLFLLQTIQLQPQEVNGESKPVAIEEVTTPSEDLQYLPASTKKDWTLTQAYFDVFKILSNQNSCSSFYRGPGVATRVLNNLVTLVKSEPLLRGVTFQMAGKPRVIRDPATGALYRLFDKTLVNINGSFYQRRQDPMRKVPTNVGSFAPGTRRARALILLHELGHMIQGENGSWLIPDDGNDGRQSDANTLRVQQMCRTQLQALK